MTTEYLVSIHQIFPYCLYLESEVRLVGGTFEYNGCVEVLTAGEWHSVCDDGFGMSNAEVICKSLGYSSKC